MVRGVAEPSPTTVQCKFDVCMYVYVADEGQTGVTDGVENKHTIGYKNQNGKRKTETDGHAGKVRNRQAGINAGREEQTGRQ